MERVKVEFETITPIWTGNAWGKCNEIKPTSIMGSLRFWFEVYCYFIGIDVKEHNKESLDYNWFKSTLEKTLKGVIENKNIQEIDTQKIAFEIIKEKLTLPSCVFGCTGWKSRVEIESINFDKKTLRDNFDYISFHSQDNNTRWWTKKILFNNRREIEIFENVTVELKIDNNVLNDFKKFIKFYEEKPILIGGKKTFGFGFVKLKSNLDLSDIKDIEIKKDDIVIWDTITINPNNITGYNIKYFLRKKENKKFRVKNFGKMSQASKYYFSCVVDNQCYIISFNQDSFILNKYKKWLENEGKKQDNFIQTNFDSRDIK